MTERTTSGLEERGALVIAPGQGRTYPMGRMKAVFKADGDETQSRYSISEWWLEPNTRGPGAHANTEDHVFYIIEGTISVLINAQWSDACRGSYIVIPGGLQHDFENRSQARAGFISFNVPGGFESEVPAIVDWFSANPPGDACA